MSDEPSIVLSAPEEPSARTKRVLNAFSVLGIGGVANLLIHTLLWPFYPKWIIIDTALYGTMLFPDRGSPLWITFDAAGIIPFFVLLRTGFPIREGARSILLAGHISERILERTFIVVSGVATLFALSGSWADDQYPHFELLRSIDVLICMMGTALSIFGIAFAVTLAAALWRAASHRRREKP